MILTLILSLSAVFAADLSSYYGPQFLKTKQDKETLYKQMISKNPKSITYDQVRDVMFKELDLKKDKEGYFVRDVYCFRNLYSHEVKGGIGPRQVPNHNDMNIEHTWPQSKFSNQFDKNTQKTDLHHLYPSNSHTNSQRGNYPFAEVNVEELADDCDASALGTAKLKGDGGTYFQPAKDHRGNVARALFYFSVRYRSIIEPTQEFYLRKWHKEDPADADEIARHEKIAEIQGVRNPFIDYPQLVDQLDNF